MQPVKDDARSYGQRCAEALVELGRHGGSGSKRDGAGPRPQLIIRAGLDTLAGIKGAPAGEPEGGGAGPARTPARHPRGNAPPPTTPPGGVAPPPHHPPPTPPAAT